MKIKLLCSVILIALCFATDASAQMGSERGYIISNTGDTLRGKIKVGTPAQRTVKIVYIPDEEDKPNERFEPFQIRGWGLDKEGQDYESQIYKPEYEVEYGYAVYMRRVNEGPVRIYEYWNTDGERGYIQTFLQRGNEKLKEVDFVHFRDKLAEYFDDFPQLSEKILRGAFKKKELLNIVTEYNTWKMRGW